MAASERTTNGELDLPDFTTESYWDERFKEEETYDWLLKYHQFSHFVEKHVNRNERILMLAG